MLNEKIQHYKKHIPEELKSRKQWIVWNKEKKPFYTVTKMASSTDPNTWLTFEESLDLLAKNRNFLGIGFCFTNEDPYVGIDLDKCIVENGTRIESWAEEILNNLMSYTEVSQSGTGFHIICKGRLPGPGKQKAIEGSPEGKLEIYDQKRFFYLTGNVSEVATIEPRHKEVEELYLHHFPTKTEQVIEKTQQSELDDAKVLELLGKAINAEKFNLLYRGEWKGNYPSHSHADQALCGLIAFYTQDVDQIDRIFSGSGLYREKWNIPSYKQRTIEKAIQGLTNVYDGTFSKEKPEEPKPACVGNPNEHRRFSIPATQFVKIPRKKRKIFLMPWLFEETITILTGARGIGKTMFVLGLAKVLSEGGNWGYWQVDDPVKVLYIDGEMSGYDLQDRLQELNLTSDNLYIRSCADHVEETNVLTKESFRTQIEADCLENNIKVLILDNKSSFTPGLNENDKEANDLVNQWLLKLRAKGLSIIYITHSGKSRNDPRGTSGITDNVDCVIELCKYEGSEFNECHFKYRFTKIRQYVGRDFIGNGEMRYENGLWNAETLNKHRITEEKILGDIHNGLSQKEMALKHGVSKGRISQIISDFEKQKLIVKKGQNLILTQFGIETLNL